MIKLVYIIRKRDDVSEKAFHEYWLHEHAPLVTSVARAIRARKYVQSHTILAETAATLLRSREMAEIFEGITEVWWDSVEDLTAGTSTPEGEEAGRLLLKDEAKFIDFQRSTIFFTEEHLIFDFTSEALEMRQQEDAVAQVSRCREVSGSEHWRGLGGHLARADAAVAAGAGKLDAALAGFESAVTIFRKYALPWEEADTLHRWGRALLAASAPDRANQKFDAAIQLYQCHGAGQRWIDRVETARKSGGADTSKESLRATTSDATFRREAEFWTLAYKSENFRLKDSKGLRYIAHLIRNEGREVRSDEVASGGAGADSDHLRHRAPREVVRVASNLGDTGVILDARAKAEYRARMTELKAELAEADGNNDVGRAEKLRFEIDALERQLASALGLGGRDRKSRSHMERARWMVTNSIKRAISKIRAGDPALARHLSTRIRTGNFCSYTPDPDHPLIWRL